MKLTILIALLICSISVSAQTSWFLRNDTPKVIKRDTQSIWFKALEFRKCRCLGFGDTVIEHWYHGWQIIDTMSTNHYTGVWESIAPDIQIESYLMPDRKTPVKYKVVYAIKK